MMRRTKTVFVPFLTRTRVRFELNFESSLEFQICGTKVKLDCREFSFWIESRPATLSRAVRGIGIGAQHSGAAQQGRQSGQGRHERSLYFCTFVVWEICETIGVGEGSRMSDTW